MPVALAPNTQSRPATDRTGFADGMPPGKNSPKINGRPRRSSKLDSKLKPRIKHITCLHFRCEKSGSGFGDVGKSGSHEKVRVGRVFRKIESVEIAFFYFMEMGDKVHRLGPHN